MKKTQPMITTVLGAIEEALSVAEELRDELENWKDSLPENLQSGSKADEIQEAIDMLEEGISKLEDAQNGDDTIHQYEFSYEMPVLSPSALRRISRAKRLEQATAALEYAPADLPEDFVDHDDADDMSDVLNDAQEALDLLNQVNFPGMR